MELDSAQDRDFIFEKFARVGEQKTGGAGLGLAICKEIIARLGGKYLFIRHRGAAFRVQVPLISIRLKRFNNLLCALSFSSYTGISNLSAHHKTVLRRKLVDTPAQQSVKQANGAFGQVIAKTAQEFGLSLVDTTSITAR